MEEHNERKSRKSSKAKNEERATRRTIRDAHEEEVEHDAPNTEAGTTRRRGIRTERRRSAPPSRKSEAPKKKSGKEKDNSATKKSTPKELKSIRSAPRGRSVQRGRPLAAHPPYSVMLKAALEALKSNTGCSKAAILKYITNNFNVSQNKNRVNLSLRLAMRKALERGELKRVRGRGVVGSFKLSEKKVAKSGEKKAEKKVPAKPKALKKKDAGNKGKKSAKPAKKTNPDSKPKKPGKK
ncbi:hypothetical protein V3C99_018891 [Haemonchus contortus]